MRTTHLQCSGAKLWLLLHQVLARKTSGDGAQEEGGAGATQGTYVTVTCQVSMHIWWVCAVLQRTGALVVNNSLPNLVNLTEDPQLSETLLYVLKPGRTTVGNAGTREKSSETQPHDIELTGALVIEDHW